MRGMRRSLRKIRAGLMAGVCLGAVEAHATDAVWNFSPVDNNWNNSLNWTTEQVPNGTATFGPTDKASIVFTNNTSIQTIQIGNFGGAAPAYSFDLSGHALTIGGKGIELDLLPPAP